VLYPALANHWQMASGEIGVLYAAVPLGAALGALTSGGLVHASRPGRTLLVSSVLALAAVSVFSLMPFWPLAFICLTLFGYLSGVSSLIQYQLIQTRTPDHMLGRINGLWTAQNVTGDAIGAAALGGMGAWLSPVSAASVGGIGLVIMTLALALLLAELRCLRQPPPEPAPH
ncbi:MFS transporter, partial [Cronobacter sakazakii]